MVSNVFLIFIPICGSGPIWLAHIFQMGGKKTPTSKTSQVCRLNIIGAAEVCSTRMVWRAQLGAIGPCTPTHHFVLKLHQTSPRTTMGCMYFSDLAGWWTRWWFQTFFIVTPTCRDDPIWLVQMGWNHQVVKDDHILKSSRVNVAWGKHLTFLGPMFFFWRTQHDTSYINLLAFVKGAWCDSSLGFLGPIGLQQIRECGGTSWSQRFHGVTVWMYEIEGKVDLIWWWALKENGCWDSLLFVSETRFLNDFEMMFIYLLLKPDFWTISVCVENFEEGPGTHDMNNTSNMKHLAFGFMCGNYVAGWSLNRASEYLKLFEVPKLWKMFSSAMIIPTHTHPTLQNVATQETMPPTASNLSIMILFMFLSSNLLLHPKWLAGYIFLSIAVTETQQVSTWTKIFTLPNSKWFTWSHSHWLAQLAKLQFKRRRIVEIQHGRVTWQMWWWDVKTRQKQGVGSVLLSLLNDA